MRYLIRVCFTIAALAIAGSAGSAGSTGQQQAAVVPLSYGITELDLTGENLPGMAVFARRENFNAHGFDVLTLYIKTSHGDGSPPVWQLVSLFNKEKEEFTITTRVGADCLLHDFRLVTSAQSSGYQLVVADRKLGKSYANAAPVVFSFYDLKKNDKNLPGRPLYYFELQRSQKAKHQYCDVGEAFSKELGLKPYGEQNH